jgi:hypothetical protein
MDKHDLTARSQRPPAWLEDFRWIKIAIDALPVKNLLEMAAEPNATPLITVAICPRYPRRPKWLLRWLLSVRPRVLGGKYTSAYVHGKLRKKF